MTKSKHKSKVSSAQEERLLLLMEECAEVSQAASKIIRFGFESKHPDNPQGPTNRVHLETEIGGLCAILELLENNKEISLEQIEFFQKEKLKTISKYTSFQN